ncbi:MAG TPA: LpxD N-terminal domain-containing protein, partial [Terriglobales bacterium]|nr:LpxD N-terminal domain-containing protein [Terriglobales bacterium]
MKRALKDVAEFLGASLIGDGKVEISGIASLSSARPGDLVFVESAKHLPQAIGSLATAIIAGEFAANGNHAKPILIAGQPRLAFARAGAWLLAKDASAGVVHPSAVIDAGANLAKNVTVEERAVIREKVSIGEGTRIGAGCVVGPDVTLGHDCCLYPNVTIYPAVQLGNRVVVHAGAVLGSDGFGYVPDANTGRYEKFPQIGRLEIEDDV